MSWGFPKKSWLPEWAREIDLPGGAFHRADWLVDLDGPESPFEQIRAADYLRILDSTGRQLRMDKRGAIDPDLAPILESIDLDTQQWLDTVTRFGSLFWNFAGKADRIRKMAKSLGRKYLKGSIAGQSAYTTKRSPG